MESTAGHSPPLNAVNMSNGAESSVPPLTAPLSPPMGSRQPPPSASADVAANALLSAFKISLEEVESYLVALDARVKCEEEYVRALRQAADKNKDNEAKLDTRIGAIASSLPGSSNLPGMRRAWKELQQDTLQQIKVRNNYIDTLRNHTIAPLRNFHDSQERIRRRVKEDLKNSLVAYDDMRHVHLKKVRRNYEKACETLETLKQHQQAVEDQKALLMAGTTQQPSRSADLARSPPPNIALHAPSASESLSHGRDTTSVRSSEDGAEWPDERPSTVTPKRSMSLGKNRKSPRSRPLSSHSSQQHGSPPDSDTQNAAQLSTSPPDASSRKNAGAFLDALRNKDTWDNARKDVAKKTNAILHKMKEGGGGGAAGGASGGSPLMGSGGAAMDRDANGSGAGRSFLGDLGSPPLSGASGLHHSASMSNKHAQFAQNMAVKISKAKRESQEADKAYRQAIFDVETLAMRREKTLSAARASVLECRRELHLTSSQSWLALNRNWQVLSSAELSLGRHCEEVLLALGADGRMESELAILDSRLPVLGGSASEDGPVPYVNYWHGECKSLLFGVSLVDYDFARNQRRPPHLGPAPVEPPLIVSKCVDFIEKHALDTPGIYRTSAKHTAVQDLCAAFEKDEVRFQFDPNTDEPAAVAGVLKQWLRELPSSVMPMPWEERLKLTHSVEEQLQNGFSTLKGRIRRLPPINQVTLKTIIGHLANVAARSEQNLMHAKNLSVVFGPVLLSDGGNADTYETTSLAAAMEADHVCAILITYADDIFSLDRAGAPVLPPLDTRETHGDLGLSVEPPPVADRVNPELPILESASPLPTSFDQASVAQEAEPGTPMSDRPLVPPGTSAPSTAGGLRRSNAVSSGSHDEVLAAPVNDFHLHHDDDDADGQHEVSRGAIPAPQPIGLPLPKLEVDRQGLVPSEPLVKDSPSTNGMLDSARGDDGHDPTR